MHRITLLAAITLLAGCVSPQARQAASAEALLNGLLARPVVADSIIRDGDVLSFQVSKLGDTQGASGLVAQLQASCTADRGNLLYLGGGGRLYMGRNPRQYSAGRPVPASVYPSLKNNPDFIKACANTLQPDWRVVKGAGEEQWVLIDRNSLKTEGGELKFWAAYDDPFIAFDLPYDAPYAQKREHYAVDCSKQTYRQIAGYDLDADNTVTDGQESFPLTSKAIAGSNDDYELLFKLACEKPASIAQLPAFAPREKKPLPVTLPAVSEAAMKAIKGLSLPPASKNLSYVDVVGKSTYKSTTTDMREERFVGIDKASGQLTVRQVGKSYESNDISFRGLFDLVSQARYGSAKETSMKDSSSLLSLSFSGDWQRMPVNGALGYSLTTRSINSVIGKASEIQKTFECTVIRDLSAGELNATLSGAAKELSCHQLKDEYERVDTYYYLQDYGYFFFASTEKNRFYYHDLTLKTAR